MGQIEKLAQEYGQHIALRWQRTVAGAQRVIMVVYDKELERTLRARKQLFEIATQQAGYAWAEIDLSDSFAQWMARDDYREAYFESPEDLQIKVEAEFPRFVAERLRGALAAPPQPENTVVAALGMASLFGFSRVSDVLNEVERDIRGRLVVFFPGQFEGSNYRLLDARDGWNYMAVPITRHGEGDGT